MIDRRVRFGAIFLQALHKSGRLSAEHIRTVVAKNWPGQSHELTKLFAGATTPVERFQRLCASPLMMRC